MALEVRGPASAPLDVPLDLSARGAGGLPVRWRARLRDDDGRVWRATAATPADLDGAWEPAKAGAGRPALASLRPVAVEVRAEAEDGRSATRTVTRVLVADGVRLRRWRGAAPGTLHLPATAPCATVVAAANDAAAVAAPLLASRGVLVLLTRGTLDRELLRAVPGAGEPVAVDLPWPPGPLGGDPAVWQELLARLGARGT